MLFQGHTAGLRAEISGSEYAMKFSEAQIFFRADNNSVQESFDRVMRHFDIQMVHSGENWFRCGDKHYHINTQPLNISYSYEKDARGDPIATNQVYKKLKHGDVAFSPFTLWSVTLIKKGTFDYTDLNKFVPNIMLELHGVGQYITENYKCHPMLYKFYAASNIIKPEKYIFLSKGNGNGDDQEHSLNGVGYIVSSLQILLICPFLSYVYINYY